MVIFILYAGGDIHPYDRFGVPLVVFSILATFIMLTTADWIQKPSWKKISYWIAACFVIGNLAYWFAPAHNITPEIAHPPNFLTANIAGLITGRKSPSEIITRFTSPPIDALEFVGRDLHDNPNINGLLAAEQCGKIPYYYDQPVLDLLGLNDKKIAAIVHDVSIWDLY
ncbi:MAG: hypothetical protein GY869_05465, partial [Planctomycetes bacterium]|nr:hypothetical protein [Planctomycetota bacterium]